MSTTIDIGKSQKKNFKHDFGMSFYVSYTVTRDDDVAVDFTGKRIKLDVYDLGYRLLETMDSDNGDILINVNELIFDYVFDRPVGAYIYRCYVDDDKLGINHGTITVN
jgi:hypothetical protein